MPAIHLSTINGKIVTVNSNRNDTVNDILRKARNKGANVTKMIIAGKEVKGNKLMRNTDYEKMGRIYIIKREPVNRNVTRVKNIFSNGYLANLKYMKNSGDMSDEELKQMILENLEHTVDKYLMSALNKM